MKSKLIAPPAHNWVIRISDPYCSYEYRFMGDENTSVHDISEVVRSHLRAPRVEPIKINERPTTK